MLGNSSKTTVGRGLCVLLAAPVPLPCLPRVMQRGAPRGTPPRGKGLQLHPHVVWLPAGGEGEGLHIIRCLYIGGAVSARPHGGSPTLACGLRHRLVGLYSRAAPGPAAALPSPGAPGFRRFPFLPLRLGSFGGPLHWLVVAAPAAPCVLDALCALWRRTDGADTLRATLADALTQ